MNVNEQRAVNKEQFVNIFKNIDDDARKNLLKQLGVEYIGKSAGIAPWAWRAGKYFDKIPQEKLDTRQVVVDDQSQQVGKKQGEQPKYLPGTITKAAGNLLFKDSNNLRVKEAIKVSEIVRNADNGDVTIKIAQIPSSEDRRAALALFQEIQEIQEIQELQVLKQQNTPTKEELTKFLLNLPPARIAQIATYKGDVTNVQILQNMYNLHKSVTDSQHEKVRSSDAKDAMKRLITDTLSLDNIADIATQQTGAIELLQKIRGLCDQIESTTTLPKNKKKLTALIAQLPLGEIDGIAGKNTPKQLKKILNNISRLADNYAKDKGVTRDTAIQNLFRDYELSSILKSAQCLTSKGQVNALRRCQQVV